MCVLVTQLCLTLCGLMDCSPPGFSVHGLLQARILEWVPILFSRRSSQPKGLNPGLLYCRKILFCLSHQGSHPRVIQNSVNNRLCCAKSLQSCLTLWNAIDCGLPGFSVHGDSPGKNTGVDWHALLQGIFPTQGLNPYLLDLLPWQADSLPLAPSRKP